MASLTIGVMLLTSVGAALGGRGIEALFFARFGVEYLPYMFVGLGITSMIMSFGMTALLSRIPKQILYVAIPLLVSVVLVLARFALLSNSNWLYPALWLGKEVLNILIGLVIWGIAVWFATRVKPSDSFLYSMPLASSDKSSADLSQVCSSPPLGQRICLSFGLGLSSFHSFSAVRFLLVKKLIHLHRKSPAANSRL